MYARPYPRAEAQARVLARVEAGYTAKALSTLPGYPCGKTLLRWAKRDPDFARRLADARAWGRGLRTPAGPALSRYDEARAQAFLLRVRRGERVIDLARMPDQPGRVTLAAWKRQRPDFAAALAEAVGFSRRARTRRFGRYDEAIADRLILRVSQGERLRDLMREPGLPGRAAIRRWRRREPAFAGALAMAVRSGIRRNAALRPGPPTLCTPALTDAVARHILHGGSLHTAARLPGMPHEATLRDWRLHRPEFARCIGIAEGMRDDRVGDRALELARGRRR